MVGPLFSLLGYPGHPEEGKGDSRNRGQDGGRADSRRKDAQTSEGVVGELAMSSMGWVLCVRV